MQPLSEYTKQELIDIFNRDMVFEISSPVGDWINFPLTQAGYSFFYGGIIGRDKDTTTITYPYGNTTYTAEILQDSVSLTTICHLSYTFNNNQFHRYQMVIARGFFYNFSVTLQKNPSYRHQSYIVGDENKKAYADLINIYAERFKEQQQQKRQTNASVPPTPQQAPLQSPPIQPIKSRPPTVQKSLDSRQGRSPSPQQKPIQLPPIPAITRSSTPRITVDTVQVKSPLPSPAPIISEPVKVLPVISQEPVKPSLASPPQPTNIDSPSTVSIPSISQTITEPPVIESIETVPEPESSNDEGEEGAEDDGEDNEEYSQSEHYSEQQSEYPESEKEILQPMGNTESKLEKDNPETSPIPSTSKGKSVDRESYLFQEDEINSEEFDAYLFSLPDSERTEDNMSACIENFKKLDPSTIAALVAKYRKFNQVLEAKRAEYAYGIALKHERQSKGKEKEVISESSQVGTSGQSAGFFTYLFLFVLLWYFVLMFFGFVGRIFK